VHKQVSEYAQAVQYSVFYAELTAQKLDDIQGTLISIIDERCDDIRIYRVNSIHKSILIGRNCMGNVLGEDVQIFS
jgi:CRISPR-associated endonuclease Cas2